MVLEVGVVCLILITLAAISFNNYLLFHSLVEVLGCTVAFAIFIISWNSRRLFQNSYLRLLGTAYLFVGLLGLMHGLAYKGIGIFPGDTSNLATQLWIATRGLETVSLLLATLLVRFRVPARATLAVGGLVTFVLLGSIFWWELFPTCYVPGEGLTLFKKAMEYAMAASLLLNIALLMRLRDQFESSVHSWIISSSSLTILAELCFTLYQDVYGLFNLTGHLRILLSFYFIYKAIVFTGLSRPLALFRRELKERQDQAYAERDRAMSYLQLAGSIIVALDSRGLVTIINKRGCEVLGLSEAQILGKPWIETFVPLRLRGEVKVGFRRLMRGEVEAVERFENPVLDQAGRERTISWHNALLRDADGQISGTLSAGEDITEQQELQRDLERTMHLAEQAAETKSLFLANMSHEIRTPMNGILGMLDLTLASEIDKEQQENLGLARRSAESLLLLLNDILDLSRLDARGLTLEQLPFDLKNLIQDSLTLFKQEAAGKGLTLVAELSPDLPDTVEGDPLRVGQVLTNLVKNALKFTQVGGVVVAAAPYDSGGEMTGVHLQVRDTGIGLSAEMGERIFDAFTQADSSTTREYGGTGLGLAISRGLVQLMGGRIWVESEGAGGSTFHFVYPVDPGGPGQRLFQGHLGQERYPGGELRRKPDHHHPHQRPQPAGLRRPQRGRLRGHRGSQSLPQPQDRDPLRAPGLHEQGRRHLQEPHPDQRYQRSHGQGVLPAHEGGPETRLGRHRPRRRS